MNDPHHSDVFFAASAAGLRLSIAAKVNDISAARAALAEGADVNFNFGTPLRHAAEAGFDDIVRLLLESGADVNAQTGAALRSAVTAGFTTTVAVLLEGGADPDANDGEPLVDAVEAGRDDIAGLLLARGAKVQVSQGHPLRHAAYNGHATMVSLLLEAGADPFDVPVNPRKLGGDENLWLVADMLDARCEAAAQVFAQAMAAATDLDLFLSEEWAGRGESALAFGVRCGLGGAMTALMEEKGVQLTRVRVENACDCDGVSLLRVAAEKNVLRELFRVALWRGRGAEAVATFETIPQSWFSAGQTSDGELAKILTLHRQAVLKEKAPKGRFKLS